MKLGYKGVNEMDLFDYAKETEVKPKAVVTTPLVDNKLNTQQHNILNHLKNYCLGKSKAISMERLAVLFNISDRKVRDEIATIRKHKPSHVIIASCDDGYYIPLESEVDEANAMLLQRWLGSTEILLGNDPRLIKLMFWKLNEMKDKLDTPLQGQTVMQFNGWEKDINYYADKYLKEKANEMD